MANGGIPSTYLDVRVRDVHLDIANVPKQKEIDRPRSKQRSFLDPHTNCLSHRPEKRLLCGSADVRGIRIPFSVYACWRNVILSIYSLQGLVRPGNRVIDSVVIL